MTPRLLFSVILASTAASKHVKDGRHFYDNHEVIDSRKYLENVYNYYSSGKTKTFILNSFSLFQIKPKFKINQCIWAKRDII